MAHNGSGTANNCDDRLSGATIVSLGNNLVNGHFCNFTATGDLEDAYSGLSEQVNAAGSIFLYGLLPGSRAIDAGSGPYDSRADAGCATRDQRRVPRPQDGDGDGLAVCDIGGFELVRAIPPGPTDPTSPVVEDPPASPSAPPPVTWAPASPPVVDQPPQSDPGAPPPLADHASGATARERRAETTVRARVHETTPGQLPEGVPSHQRRDGGVPGALVGPAVALRGHGAGHRHRRRRMDSALTCGQATRVMRTLDRSRSHG